jgi:hypothetical protein
MQRLMECRGLSPMLYLLTWVGGFAMRTQSAKRVWKPIQREAKADAVSSTTTKLEERSPDQAVGGTKNIPQPRESWIYHLTGEHILIMRRSGQLPRLPYITSEAIEDRSKSDSLVRVIAVTQILWNVVQVLVRGARHLAVSQLEITVIAFATCAVFIYILNWSKPKGVQTPITLIAYQDGAPPQVLAQFTSQNQGAYQKIHGYLAATGTKLFGIQRRLAGSSLSNLDTLHQHYRDGRQDVVAALGASIVFGGIHIAAWNFQFPSRAEQIIWRAASLWCTCGFALCCVVGISVSILEQCFGLISVNRRNRMVNMAMNAYVIIYILARLYLIVEIFRTLGFLPPSAYYSTWATNIPHVA